MHAGTRNAELRPSGIRAAAVLIDADGQHLDLFVPVAAAARILPDVRGNGQIAISFGRPVDDRACQVKGTVLDVRDATPSERPTVDTQWDGFMRQLELIGIPRAMAGGWASWPAIVMRVRVTAVFEQTPGPQAGVPIA